MEAATAAAVAAAEGGVVVIREYAAERDRVGVEAVERRCEVAPSGGGMCLYTDLLGDPLCRVRHSPPFLMLVRTPLFIFFVFFSNLIIRLRLGIGLKLVDRMEEWFKEKGAEYAYMATEKDNEASIRLFTERCGYSKFRTPAILVQPVFAHRLTLPRAIAIIRLPATDAEAFYRRRFAATEFFPRDIDAVLANPLSLGTFLAVPAGCAAAARWEGADAFLADPPSSWAVASVWNSKEVFRLEVRGAGLWRRALALASRAVDWALPWLRIPSVPDLFRPFGMYLVYGLGGEGPAAAAYARAVCRHAHNMARTDPGCRVVAAEVAACEPLREGIPHWSRLSCAEDLWCVKRLAEEYTDGALGDWTKAPPPPSIFVDPREF
ncbi:hypothetical protein GW17_00034287 [Ensete ventricosum]|nr:hypothetical protein GW17_00034287 [Ensete ventricosum]